MGGGPAKDVVLFLLPVPEPKEMVAKLRSAHPGIDVRYQEVSWRQGGRKGPDDKGEPDPSVFKDVTVLVTFVVLPPSPSDAPRLDFIQLFSAGSNQIASHPIYTDTDITISTATGIHGPQIAEWVVMTSLVHSHKYKSLYELQKRHKWGKDKVKNDYSSVRDKVGQRLGVLGYGSIGRQVGRVAKALGMDVVAFTASPKDTPDSRRDKGFIVPGTGDADGSTPSEWYSGLDRDSLHAFLTKDIDILLVSVPLTNDTKGMLGKQEFAALSQGGQTKPFVVNIARGSIIKQAELITALKDGTLGGAALDVTDPEPLPEDSELWDLENVIVTPHVSGQGSAYNERGFMLLDEQLRRRERGDKPYNVIQRKRGY